MTLSNEDGLEKAAQYAEDVLSGKILTGTLTKLAIQRNEADLKEAANRGLFFCEDSAWRVLKFFDFLRHTEGKEAGKRIILEPWQCWKIATVFGWINEETGGRRFSTAYTRVGRKNGKTTELGGIGNYGLTKDNEGGPQIYAVAASREQAGKLFSSATNMIKKSPALRARLDVQKKAIYNPSNLGVFSALSADAGLQDGHNPHMVLFDELHAQKNAALWNVMESSMVGSRLQALMWAITTAGYITDGICYELEQYVIKILQGIEENDSIFGLIYALDEDDDWRDSDNWIKANPNLGVSVGLKELEQKAKKAELMPTARVDFFIKHLNLWVSGKLLWCNVDKWKECGAVYDWEWLKDNPPKELYLGLDLASISDMCSLTGVAVMPDGTWKAIGKHYLPEDVVTSTIIKTNAKYHQWEQDGWLTTTPGNITDYNWIKADVLWIMENFNVVEIAFDKHNSSQLVNDLMEKGAPMLSFAQGFQGMNAPMIELERRYSTGLIQHNNDPVLNFAMANVVALFNEYGQIRPSKRNSAEKIDSAVALIMAVGRAMLVQENQIEVGCEIW